MYLRRLEIQGYKSFANRTVFEFGGGITAIVGPNGSGKSNIADAVRWALGEQSYSTLRAKRTEDLIFSGSSQRARVGLAEVSLVFDNSTQWLPIDYTEVTITRRAYRSGEIEYYLNGNRVRLRDISELLGRAGLGRNVWVVIGQGQVDAALSLRPEERRSLFEEASGVRVYIDKRNEALARLDETRRNLERVTDIISEISPRVESLRRQAERTREYDMVKRDLETCLLQWYGFQWQRHQDRIARVEEQIRAQNDQVAQQRDRVAQAISKREALRNRQQALREEIQHRRQEAEQLRIRHEELRRRLAVAQERTKALLRQQEQARADQAGIEARRAEIQSTLERQIQEQAVLQAGLAKQQIAAAAAKAELAAAEAALRAQRDEFEHARAQSFEIATAQATARNHQNQLQRRQSELEQELATQERALADISSRMDAAARDLQGAEEAQGQALAALGSAEEDLRQAEDNLAASLSRLDQLRMQRDAARETYQRLRTQHDVLHRARTQATFLHEGAQAIIREQMPGVLGTIASLFEVPAELDVAMEAALGSHLQDVVVKTWNDALACIDFLKRRQRGRAAFLPLDYVRAPHSIPAPRLPGVRGVAARLIKTDPIYADIAELLLGNIIIAEDLTAGRRGLAAEHRLRRAVTLDGDVVEARGVVRGGSRPRSLGVLAQEREWRELPRRLTSAQQALREAESQVKAEDEKQQAYRQQVRECGQRLQACRTALSQQEQRVNALRQRHDRLLQEVGWRRSLQEQARQALQGLQPELAQVEQEIASLQERSVDIARRVEELRASTERDDITALRQCAAEQETALAVALRTQQAQEQFIVAQREALARTQAEAEARQQRLEQGQQEMAALEQELERIRQTLAGGQQALDNANRPLAQAEAELQANEKQQLALEAEEEQLRQQLQTLQTELNRMGFERDRAREELEEIRRQMEAELGPVEVPDVGQPRQLRLALGNGVTPLPQVTQLPEGLSHELKELRTRLRRLGPINPSAPAEYEQLAERHQFLADQVQDLTKAADSTREIIEELNRLIRERFTATFAHVAREFSSCFSTLFSGGSAKLILTEPENPAESGIEIIARPPGKRSQSLSLLSGGERSLTAVALLFALLKVNPLPFCILDEVDAMLDESNVHRFRSFLEALARQTQFIVITHNRNTVEAAATVYGISMAQEGVSTILSLRLPEESREKAAQDNAAASPAA